MIALYLFLAVLTLVMSLACEKVLEGQVTVGKLIFFVLLSFLPVANVLLLLAASVSLFANAVDMEKKVF